MKEELGKNIIKAIGKKANFNVTLPEFSLRDLFLWIKPCPLSLKIPRRRIHFGIISPFTVWDDQRIFS